MGTAGTGAAPASDTLITLGRVAGAHGVRGWLRIQPYSDGAPGLLAASHWVLASPAATPAAGVVSSTRRVRVQQSRLHGALVIAQLDGVADRDAALALRGWSVCLRRADFPPTQGDEYYWVDLIGCRVYGEKTADDGPQVALLGEVHSVMDNGAHGILRVLRQHELPDGSVQACLDAKGRVREELVPFVAAHVHTVDLPARRLLSHWPVE